MSGLPAIVTLARLQSVEEQSCREFASADPAKAAQDAGRRINSEFLSTQAVVYNGVVTPASDLRSLWRPGSQHDAENQLRRISIPARDHSSSDLAGIVMSG